LKIKTNVEWRSVALKLKLNFFTEAEARLASAGLTQIPCVVCTLCEPVNDVLKLINVQQKIVVMKNFTKVKLKNKS